jgi:hypothetical protein
MMRRILALLITSTLAVSVATPIAVASTKRVAVLPLTNSASVPTKQIRFLTQVIRQEGINALAGGPFQILTQANLEALLPPGKTLADCIDECAIKTGRNLKAHYVITGQLQKAAGSYRLMLGVYATRKGTYLDALTLVGRDILQLEQQIKRRARAAYATIRTDAQGSRFALGGSGAIVLETDAPQAITMAKRPRDREFVSFTSKPSGVSVVVDERPVCKTPCQRVMPRGRRAVQLRGRCFEPASTQVNVVTGEANSGSGGLQTSGVIEVVGGGSTIIPLKPRTVPLSVQIVVDDAQAKRVFLDGLGQTLQVALSDGRGQKPLTLSTCTAAPTVDRMVSRRYTLTVSAPGYVSVSKSFDTSIGAPPPWTVRLKRIPRLTLVCDDAKAAIYLGDEKKGRGRVELELPPGEYRAACGIPNAPDYTQRTNLAPGDNQSLSLTVAKMGQIQAECRTNGFRGAFLKIVEEGILGHIALWDGPSATGDGAYTLRGQVAARPGVYTVSCGYTGGETESQLLVLKSVATEVVRLKSETSSALPTESGYSILGAFPPNFLRGYIGLTTDLGNELGFLSGYGFGGYEYRPPMSKHENRRLGFRLIGCVAPGGIVTQSANDDPDPSQPSGFNGEEEEPPVGAAFGLLFDLYLDYRWTRSGLAAYSPLEINLWGLIGGIPGEDREEYDDDGDGVPDEVDTGKAGHFILIQGLRITQYLGVGPNFRIGPQVEVLGGSFVEDFFAILFGGAIEIPLWETSSDRRFNLRGAYTQSADGAMSIGVSWILKSMSGDTAFGLFNK